MSRRISGETDRSVENVKTMKKFTSIEENNNEIVILATNFQNMGGVADKCIQNLEAGKENGMIEEKDDFEDKNRKSSENRDMYDYDSDEFENDLNDEELEESVKTISTVAIVHSRESRKNSLKVPNPINVCNSERAERSSAKSSKSTEKVSFPQNGKALQRKMSNSTTSLSGTMREARRLNWSFSNYRAREIHRENHILMHKLIAVKSNLRFPPPFKYPSSQSSSGITRRRNQEKAGRENEILLRKIQDAKCSYCGCEK